MSRERQILTVDLYDNLIEINKEESIALKREQLNIVESINDSYSNILDSQYEIKTLKGKIRLEKRTMRHEEWRLFKTNFRLSSLSKKMNKLNKLFASDFEKKVDTSKFVLTKKKK